MPPKKARDSRRQRREDRQQRQGAAQESQPQPASTSTSTSASSSAAAAAGPTSQPIDPTVLSALLEATQRNPSSTIGLRLGSDLSVVMVPKSQHDPSSPSLSSAASQALTSVLSRKDQETGISVVTSYPAPLQPSTTVSLDKDTSSGGGWRNFLEAPNSDDDISEPSTSSDAAATSSPRSSRTQNRQPKISDKKKKKKKVLLEVSTTPNKQQEELASLVNLCLRSNNPAAAAAADGDHLRTENRGGPSTVGPAGDDDAAIDHEGTPADHS